MTLSQFHPYLSPEAYLEAEKSSLNKHEYIQRESKGYAGFGGEGGVSRHPHNYCSTGVGGVCSLASPLRALKP